MNDTKLVRFRLQEWEATQMKAKHRWERHSLGKRPTFKEVKENLPNPHSISVLEYLAMIVLVVLTIFTSYKVGALAIPFAEGTLDTLSNHTYISELVKQSFITVTALLFMLLATPSVIYFKLLSAEPEVTAEKKATKGTRVLSRWTLDYLTPRLPSMVVYFSVAWLVVISSQLPGTIFEQYLPVVVEIALATLVGNILKKRRDFNKVVWDALKEKTDPYDTRLKNFEKDSAYLRTLYQTMREELSSLKREGKRVNAWIEAAEEREVFTLVSQEYHRLTGGTQFAEQVLHKTQTPAAQADTEISIGTLRRPPAGDPKWTPETLEHDLRVRGIDPSQPFGEGDLQKQYAPGYDARRAWRSGARQRFLGK